MKDELTKAYINLFSILRNLEDLCELDSECKELINNKNLDIMFYIKGGPKAILRFKDGKCSLIKGNGKCDMNLFFTSPKHFNDMIDGKANPMPLKGFSNIKFLKNQFTTITDRLSYYLKPTDELLMNPQYFKINTILSFYAAFMALVQIVYYDAIGKINAKRIPDGVMSIGVIDGPNVSLYIKNGTLSMKKEKIKNPRASMEFDSLETVNKLLNRKIDAYSCIALEKIRTKGYIPIIDNFNKILSQVSEYLK